VAVHHHRQLTQLAARRAPAAASPGQPGNRSPTTGIPGGHRRGFPSLGSTHRVRYKRVIRAIRRPGFFIPDHDQRQHALAQADITSRQNLNCGRERSYPRVVKRARPNSYRVKKPGDHGTRHDGPADHQARQPSKTQVRSMIKIR
jgi:hypothetical protein